MNDYINIYFNIPLPKSIHTNQKKYCHNGGIKLRALVIILCVLFLQSSLFAESMEANGQSDSRPKIIKALDLLERIENGAPIEYRNVIIEGDMNLSSLQLSSRQKERSEFEQEISYISTEIKLIESPISIIDSKINGLVCANNIFFNQSITLKGCLFDQDVQFRGAQFAEDVSIQDSTFAGITYFEWAEFYGKADFQKSIFNESSHFLEAVFSDDASFSKTKFGNFVDMRGTEFNGSADFDLANFEGYAHFNEVLFSGKNNFRSAQFNSPAIFWAANFDGDSDFRGAKFGDAVFSNTQFQGTASFGDTTIEGNADFRESAFSDDLLFEDTLISGDVTFKGATFEKNVDFQNAVMLSKSDFSRAQFSNNRNSITKFLNTTFGGNASFAYCSFSPVVQMRNSRFNGSLNMTEAIFDRMELDWEDIKGRLIGDDPIYILMINNFRNLGQFEDQDNSIYQYGRYRLAHENSIWSYLKDFLSWIICGFGVRPQYTFAWAILLIIIFGYIYYSFGALLKESRSQSAFQFKKFGRKVRTSTLREALYFSTMVFTLSLPALGLRPADKWRYAVMLEDILGWIIMTLFVVTLGNVMIR